MGSEVDAAVGHLAGGGAPARDTGKAQSRGVWSAEIEAQVKGLGLLQPLLKCCANGGA